MKISNFIIAGTIVLIAAIWMFNPFTGKGKTDMSSGNKNHSEFTNHLINEKSPYLLQHAHNPVDWYPWGEEAFAKARRENKLIFLSIGYSACHWCHVMAHESFENDSIAALMNRYFVSIKVDREELPDVDHLYQTFVQMTSGSGGWPLSVFLTPDLVPIYGGTYFPGTPRYGRISFPDLLRRIEELYRNDPQKITRNSQEIVAALRKVNRGSAGDTMPNAEQSINRLYQNLRQNFDQQNGGFSPAPKFPHVSDMDFLLNYYHYTGEAAAKEMTLFTLRKMAEGGLYDQIGGGFHRYSTDQKWLVPHFEKMLYDNALLIPLFANAYRLTGDEFYRRIARETAEFVLRELTDPNGGFYATLDADSEGKEGKFYVWDYREIRRELAPAICDAFCEYYGVSEKGNFEGANILHITRPLKQVAEKYQLSEDELPEKFRQARRGLMKIRSKRVRPGLDNKILADWNGMMISALWQVYQITGEEKYKQAARKATTYFTSRYLDEDLHLAHFVKNEREKIDGYLDDYAYFIQALLDGFETSQQAGDLKLAIQLTDRVLKIFRDPQTGNLYFTPGGRKNLLTRIQQTYDSSTPAGSNIMTLNLLRLHAYTGNRQFLNAAEQVFKSRKTEIETRGSGVASLVRALLYHHFTPLEITVATTRQELPTSYFKEIFSIFTPNRVLVHTNGSGTLPLINPLLLADRQAETGTSVYICYRQTCSLPVKEIAKIRKVIEEFNLKID